MTVQDQDLRFVVAAELPLTVVWRAFLDGFRDYLVPVQIEEGPFATLLEAESVDLSASIVALDNIGNPVGICLLAIRGSEGWCGGLGVAPSLRRQGLGRELMLRTVARARGLRLDRFRLECIDANTAALRLYRELGFQVTCRLDIFDGVPSSSEAGEPNAEPGFAAQEMIRPVAVWDAFSDYHAVSRPWQQDLPSLRLTVRTESLAGFAIGDQDRPVVYLLYREPDQPEGRVTIVDSGWRSSSADPRSTLITLARALVARYPRRRISASNVAEDDALNQVLRTFGVSVTLSQSEMVLELRGQDGVEQLAR